MRGASLAFGILVTWGIATFGALVVAVVVSWPLALYRDGDVFGSRTIGFVLGMVGFGVWATRTSITLVRDHRADAAAFRTRWPRAARGAELEALGLLDRRGQPGRASTGCGAHDVDLRGGERAEKTLVLGAATNVHLAVHGPADAIARVVDVELDERGRATVADRGSTTFPLGPGTYRLMTERTDSSARQPERVQSWWIGAVP